MLRTLVLAAILLMGCAPHETQRAPAAYSAGNSARNLDVMQQCATLIAKAPFMLSDDERNWHYQRCLIENNATI